MIVVCSYNPSDFNLSDLKALMSLAPQRSSLIHGHIKCHLLNFPNRNRRILETGYGWKTGFLTHAHLNQLVMVAYSNNFKDTDVKSAVPN